MISPLQAHFTTLHYPINQGDSKTQRKLPCLSRLTQRTLGFDGFLYAFAGISGLMYFEISTFDFSAPLNPTYRTWRTPRSGELLHQDLLTEN